MYGDVEVRPFDETSKRRDSASRRGTRWLSLRRQQACDRHRRAAAVPRRQAGGRGGASRGSCAVRHVVVEGVAEGVLAHAKEAPRGSHRHGEGDRRVQPYTATAGPESRRLRAGVEPTPYFTYLLLYPHFARVVI